MAEYRLPHEIIYETEEPVSIREVVASLTGIEELFIETGDLLELCFPGITVEKIPFL